MADNVKLPGSSYEELVKIIKAYSTGKVGQPMSLETIAQTTGMDKTIVSRNNGFLVQVELISEGNKKSPTDIGINLGRAYNLKMDTEVTRIWMGIIESNEFLGRMLSAIKIRDGMEKSGFINHILYSSGSSTNNSTRAGANTIVEIFKSAGLVTESDGKIIACETSELSVAEKNDNSSIPIVNDQTVISLPKTSTSAANITININIDVTGEQLDELPEKLKKLLESIAE